MFQKGAGEQALHNSAYPLFDMGHVYMAQKDYPKAVEAYRDAKRFVTDDIIIYWLGTALYEAGRTKEAITELHEGTALAPQNANIRYALALAYLKGGDKKSAIAEFKKAAELAPRSELAQKANDYLKILR